MHPSYPTAPRMARGCLEEGPPSDVTLYYRALLPWPYCSGHKRPLHRARWVTLLAGGRAVAGMHTPRHSLDAIYLNTRRNLVAIPCAQEDGHKGRDVSMGFLIWFTSTFD